MKNIFYSLLVGLICVAALLYLIFKINNPQETLPTNDTAQQQLPTHKQRIGVKFSKHIDGDTSEFIIDGQKRIFRYLLIDTPETKHPRLGVQPFGLEASHRTKELLTHAKRIEVEYDIGQRNDKYGRNLVYVYVDGTMLNEILVREGFASVAYVYPPNIKYIDRLEKAENQAKSDKIGIWSLQDVHNESNTPTPAKTKMFNNCKELRKVYPNGVNKTHPAYQPQMDGDKDGFACEAS